MEMRKNTDIVKLLFKIKTIKKSVLSISNHLKSIKVLKTSAENYVRCNTLYQEGTCYFFQCCGFLKSQYFVEGISTSCKKFLVNKLFIPSYKKFIELRQSLSTIEVEPIYENSLQLLKKNIECINNSMSELLGELNKI